MRILSLLFILLASVQGLVVVDSDVASACIYYMKQFDWGCGSTGQGMKAYMCRCANVDWLGSVSHCIAEYGENRGKTRHAWHHVRTRCIQKADLYYSVDELEAYSENATQYLKQPTAMDAMKQVYHPLGVNESAFGVYLRSFRQINHHVYKSQWLGWGLVFYWAALVVIYTLANLSWKLFRFNLFGKTLSQIHQKYLCQDIGLFGLNRLNVIVMFLSLVQTVLSTALSYTVELPNVYMTQSYFLTLDLIGYRSAILSFSLMPVCYIFGLRNNPFTWMTGLPQAEFIKYHKFVALIFSLEALVHSSIWTAYAIRSDGYKVWAVDDYWRWGIVGTVLLFLMIGQSIRIVRSAIYETFLFVHKIFGWLFIVSMWYHCNILGWMGWVYSLIALVAYDRVMRLFKTFVINRGYVRIRVSVIDSRVLKITIPKPSLFDVAYEPGTYLYMSFYHWPIWYQCWQSHPFSILSSPVEAENHIIVYVRVKKGNTKSLSTLKTDEKGNVYMWALIEGPYGEKAEHFGDNDAVVGISGGMGVCSILPAFYNNSAISRLYWVINNPDELEILRADLDYLADHGCDVRVFLTHSVSKEDSISLEKMAPYLTLLEQRPDVGQFVAEAVQLAHESGKTNLSILSCGPGHMDSQIKHNVGKQIKVGSDLSIRYISENSQW
ncbi:hypothetical protein E0198_003617 [Clavispora lusitaniae]|nr:hypothetical protein E0198_003617 [Clavispora lusitaniae]